MKLVEYGRAAVEVVRCLVVFPVYFFVITLFALWPWRLRTPFVLLRSLGIPEHTRRASRLRLLMFRLAVRTDWESRAPHAIRFRAFAGWLLHPYRETIPRCWALARGERARSGISRPASLALFFRSLPDSLRYANGFVSRYWFDPERRADAGFHIPNEHHVRVGCFLLNHANDPSMAIEQRHLDKAALALTCRERGWPAILVYASFRDGRTIEHEPVGEGALISKPSSLAQGYGHFERWVRAEPDPTGPSRYRGDEGEVLSLAELLAHLEKRSRVSPYMLQPLLRPHRIIRELSAVNTLCTLRLPTCCFPEGHAELLDQSYFRMPQYDSPMDNRSQGAVAYSVDNRTGSLLSGALKTSHDTFTVHPSSQREVLGFELPYFDEAVELATTVHAEAFSSFPSVGWDMALTDDGPVIVEMNIQWNSEHNLPGEAFLGQTRYSECILAHMGRHWPQAVPEWGGQPRR